MSKKRTKYTSASKTKLVLELLQNKSTLVQIASKHNNIKLQGYLQR
jgi:transposase-like protein